MIKRSCLIVDNEDQTEEIEKLVRDAEHIGIQLECDQFNVGNTRYSDILTNGLIDISKVVVEYRKKFNNHYFDLIAFDWDLEDEHITGVDLIRQFTSNKIARHSPKMVYSGVLDDVIKKIVQDNLDIKKIGGSLKPIIKDAAVTKIKSLVKNRVCEYLNRDHRDPMILKFLKEDMQSTELVIAQTLKKFPELTFNNRFINPSFRGKTFEEIAVFLESDDVQGNEFKREIIEQVLAYLTENQ
ncbi:hypothetical protein I6I97_02070 [Sphingobacterium multivorum]|uniref:hypothetical protein n=1 Tax=Sphingobacterium multivorum TaxID=28454 RepID=UPI0019195680|nr:hypothetical protein [Sphingobacterium multivorum]QQT62628.1 hypothetical protein I6I97_02070 [Sphingobacterium multivorum]